MAEPKVEQPENTNTPENPEVVEPSTPDATAMASEIANLKASNTRLLGESKGWKTKYQNERSTAEQQETEKLQAKDDYKGLYEQELKKVSGLQVDLLDSKKDGLKASLKLEVSKHAKDAVDIDDIIYNISKNATSFAYDKDNKKWDGIDKQVEELRVSKPNLFDAEKVTMIDGRPSNMVHKNKTEDELIKENPLAVLDDAIANLLT